MGKTAVFIIGVLNQLATRNGQFIPFNCLVISHTRELAHQIFKDFLRLSRYFKNPDLKLACYFGGFKMDLHR
jgi:superfamily II DNA/RNA helicase